MPGGRRRTGRPVPGSPDGAPGPPDAAAGPPGDPETVARLICLRQLEQRARSRAELSAKLAERGVPEDAADRVLDRFAEVGLIDDAALARQLAGSAQRERGLARRAIATNLRRRGLDDETVGEALADTTTEDERARAAELVRRRQRALAALPVEVQTRRLVGLLARKGYPAGVAYGVVRDTLAGLGAESEALDCVDVE